MSEIQDKTAATQFLDAQHIAYKKISYDYVTQPGKIGVLAAEKLHLTPQSLLKTIMIELDKGARVVCAMIPVDQKIDFKKIRNLCGARKACMLAPQKAEELSGYQCGGISPFGLKTAVPVIFDASISHFDDIYLNGGHRGLVVKMNREDAINILHASTADVVKV